MAAPMQSCGPPWFRVRREPFDFGLLPLAFLMQNDGLNSLLKLKSRLSTTASASAMTESLTTSSEDNNSSLNVRITSGVIASCLGISQDHSRLILDALASILPDDCGEIDPLVYADDVDVVGADLDYLLLFFYIQIYKRVSYRGHRDAVALADLWPSSPASFDHPTTGSSLLSIKTSPNSRQRSFPAQAEEESNQLSFVQKHLLSLLTLLAQQDSSGDENSKVLSGEKLNRLNLLLRVANSAQTTNSFSESTPFFANCDPDMPAIPISLNEIHNFLSSHICAYSKDASNNASNHISPTSSTNSSISNSSSNNSHNQASSPNSPSSDVIMSDSTTNSNSGIVLSPNSPTTSSNGPFSNSSKEYSNEGMTCIDGLTKMFAMKSENDIDSGSIKISSSNDSVLYILAPLKYVSISGCTDSIVVLGAVGKALKVEHCERLQLIVACARIKIVNCRDCTFYLGSNRSPLILGDNHNLQLAPYNTFYPKLDSHLNQVKVDNTINRWDFPIILTTIDPHDSISRSMSNADLESQSVSLLAPEKFNPFVVPVRPSNDQSLNYTRSNPFVLPKPYIASLQQKLKSVDALRQTLRTVNLEESKKKELTSVIQAHFKEWLYTSGNVRQIYDITRLDREF